MGIVPDAYVGHFPLPGLNGGGFMYSADQLGLVPVPSPLVAFTTSSYSLGPVPTSAAPVNNVLLANGSTIALPLNVYASIKILATTANSASTTATFTGSLLGVANV